MSISSFCISLHHPLQVTLTGFYVHFFLPLLLLLLLLALHLSKMRRDSASATSHSDNWFALDFATRVINLCGKNALSLEIALSTVSYLNVSCALVRTKDSPRQRRQDEQREHESGQSEGAFSPLLSSFLLSSLVFVYFASCTRALLLLKIRPQDG